ncbi:hypothetical protein C791_5801 [Amycolatopsis azurea DSM 43854]|uniref:Uncharacterized protein n=1 Tax=Amycolatopsis azurea DSM 43854 TaxID=1238180 RepID=M2QDF3_9PSEU|nr:hypothetical protein C791_5801 [Amycolatopsis azurea DSM 43854]
MFKRNGAQVPLEHRGFRVWDTSADLARRTTSTFAKAHD